MHVLVKKHEGKRPLGILRRRWDKNMKMDLEGVGWVGVANYCGNLYETLGSTKCAEFLDWLKSYCFYILYHVPSCDEHMQG